jgi:hypothetical protein
VPWKQSGSKDEMWGIPQRGGGHGPKKSNGCQRE